MSFRYYFYRSAGNLPPCDRAASLYRREIRAENEEKCSGERLLSRNAEHQREREREEARVTDIPLEKVLPRREIDEGRSNYRRQMAISRQ